MASFSRTIAVASDDVAAVRAVCDGCDPARPVDEHCPMPQLWVVTRGAFELRDGGGRWVLDPTVAMVIPSGHAFRIRHPSGPDVCLSFRGPLVDRMAERGARLLPLGPAGLARLLAEVTACRAGSGDPLAVAEAIAGLDPDGGARATTAADRELVAAVAHTARLRFAGPVSLRDLAQAAGYSVFHACRVFQRVTGTTIHDYLREVRLRHALAMLLDDDASLTDVAALSGFSSQSHLTNRFRERFGVTPGAARKGRGLRVS